MEIVTALPPSTSDTNNGTKKHVEEWSRLDHLTGMLETARVEADQWASNTSNSRHRFGKVPQIPVSGLQYIMYNLFYFS